MLEAGQSLAHFKIIRKLGEGGMGAVYLAEDQKLSRQVALKTLSESVSEDSEWMERFRREARTAAQVTHPNVMAIYDIDTARHPTTGQELSYIVMEYVKGQSLGEYARVNQPELSKIVRLAEKIAGGLAAAHRMNIVHRDIKADNIIVDQQGDPKILDFGLAKPVDQVKLGEPDDATETISQELTRAGKILGTVTYMSPEQVQGKPVDRRSDIFSYGTLLYRLCTGEAPFAGQSQVSTMARILEDAHPAPRTKNENIPPELERIIDKCLRKDPDDRYQDTRDLVVDLRNLRRQYDSGVTGAITAPTDSRLMTAQRKSMSAPVKYGLMLLAGVAVVLIILLGTDRLSLTVEPEDAPVQKTNSLAILGFENKTDDPDLAWLQTGLPEILLTDLSQNQDIKIISQRRILDCFEADKKINHTFDECAVAAKSIGANSLLSGAFFKLGDKIRIDARLEDVSTGKIILGEKVVGDDPFALVDSLTSKISASLNLSHTGNVTTFTSSSPEAFRHYHAGLDHFWEGRYDDAISEFHKAVAIDSAFALPYMRIAMANVFQNRQDEGKTYFRIAKQYEDRLPTRERGLLDAYVDTWLNNDFSRAFTKMTTLLRDYPDDAEIRTIYALFIDAFQRDTSTAFAHLDTVLASNPSNIFALENYAQLQENWGNQEEALQLTERLREIIPQSVLPLTRLSRLYDRSGRRKDAIAMTESLMEKHPADVRPVERLISMSIRDRDFPSARKYVQILKRQRPTDPFTLFDFHNYLANLANWRGRFRLSLEQRHAALDQAYVTQDSQLIYSALGTIASYHLRYYDDADSSLAYRKQADSWATTFVRMSYPMNLVKVDTGNCSVARPLLKERLEQFKAMVPKEFWGVANMLEDILEADCMADTARLIAAYQALIANQKDVQSDNVRVLGELLVKAGRFQEGKEMLERFLSGKYETSSGWVYPYASYYVGIANEGLGNTAEAIKNYREVLRFWGKSDVELKEIRDTRRRLARLMG